MNFHSFYNITTYQNRNVVLNLSNNTVSRTYSKHLEIIGTEGGKPIGTLRMQMCLRTLRDSSFLVKKKISIDEMHRTHKVCYGTIS